MITERAILYVFCLWPPLKKRKREGERERGDKLRGREHNGEKKTKLMKL